MTYEMIFVEKRKYKWYIPLFKKFCNKDQDAFRVLARNLQFGLLDKNWEFLNFRAGRFRDLL